MFRVRLCEFVASKFSFRNLKNKTAKSQGTLIEITGIEQNIFSYTQIGKAGLPPV